MSNVRPTRDHEALPPPTQPAARDAWAAANLTSAEIRRRHDPKRFQAFRWKRDPQHRRTLRLAIAALACPLLGPYVWRLANAELAAIRSGLIAPTGRRRIAIAKTCAIIATLALFVAIAMLVVSLS
jgi:hypothetical protein